MAILDILVYPDPRLRQKAEPVTEFDESLKTLVNDMAETMYAAPGIGLAATQVNVHKRLVVMDLSDDRDDLMVFANPEVETIDGRIEYEEGCLSVPGVFENVERVENVIVKAQDINGEPFELKADGLLSVCIQHEIDHLNGKVFVDYLSRIKQDRARKKLKKDAKLAQTKAA